MIGSSWGRVLIGCHESEYRVWAIETAFGSVGDQSRDDAKIGQRWEIGDEMFWWTWR